MLNKGKMFIFFIFKITSSTVVCSKHFKKDDYKWTPVNKTLKKDAVPLNFTSYTFFWKRPYSDLNPSVKTLRLRARYPSISVRSRSNKMYHVTALVRSRSN